MNIAEINAKALALTSQLTTEQLVEAWELSDAKLALTTDAASRSDIFTARGWIMEVLEGRHQLWRIVGIEVDTRVSYEDMANPRREGWISGDLGDSWAIRWDENEFVYNLVEQDGVRFHTTVTKDMLRRGAERTGTGGWNVIS